MKVSQNFTFSYSFSVTIIINTYTLKVVEGIIINQKRRVDGSTHQSKLRLLWTLIIIVLMTTDIDRKSLTLGSQSCLRRTGGTLVRGGEGDTRVGWRVLSPRGSYGL